MANNTVETYDELSFARNGNGSAEQSQYPRFDFAYFARNERGNLVGRAGATRAGEYSPHTVPVAFTGVRFGARLVVGRLGRGARPGVTRLDNAPQNVEAFSKERKKGMMADYAQRGQRMGVLNLAGSFAASLFDAFRVGVAFVVVRLGHGAQVGLLLLKALSVAGRLVRVRWRHFFVYGSEEVDANAVAHSGRVFFGEREYEAGRVLVGVGSLHVRTVDVGAAFGLTKKRHVLGQHEVVVILERVSSQQLGQLIQMRLVHFRYFDRLLRVHVNLLHLLHVRRQELCRRGWLSTSHDDYKIDQPRARELFAVVAHFRACFCVFKPILSLFKLLSTSNVQNVQRSKN